MAKLSYSPAGECLTPDKIVEEMVLPGGIEPTTSPLPIHRITL